MEYLIDIGSSTVKVYLRDDLKVKLILAKTFDFKDKFDNEKGLSDKNKNDLYTFFKEISNKFSLSRCNTKLYATGIFREFTNKQAFIEDFYVNTHLYFNIVSHELEAFYLEKAWVGNYMYNKPLLVINIGGKTTELVFFNEGHIIERKLLSLGVGTILKKYTDINKEFSPIDINEIEEYVKCNLPHIEGIYDTAIYTGGELTYMKIANYKLVKNVLFSDINHPLCISLDDYSIQNNRIFNEISISDLRNMMPNNPLWMDGARACSAIAQAICKYYRVKTIVPSDTNLIDGVNVQEVSSVVVCGSFNKHLEKISQLINKLKSLNINVLSPLNTEIVGSVRDFVLFANDKIVNHSTWSVEAFHLKAIEYCDMVIVCNFDGYIGTKTSLEIGYAYKCGKKITFLNNNEIVQDFDIPSEIGLLQD